MRVEGKLHPNVCGSHVAIFPDMDGVGYLHCEDETDDSFSYEDWETHSEPEEEMAPSAGPATFCGLKKAFLCKPSAPTLLASSSLDASLLSFVLPQKQQVTAEEAERNAKELVAEEERAKKKAEKKRLKKKRQKDRKRQEKHRQELESKGHAQPANASSWQEGASHAGVPSVLGSGPPEPEDRCSQDPSKNRTSPGCSTEEEEEEELDLSSTFVSKARLKVSPRPPLRKGRAARPQQMEQQVVPGPGLQKTASEQSMVLADCGNETAQRGSYWEAVLLFTEAVKLNPREYRFFGNRSFCYEKLQCYPEALRDAQLALRLQPGWPKGLFRQGKALMGLKQYAAAARTFEELLQVDGLRGDAATQLQRCRAQLLLQNSFGPCAAAAPLPLPPVRSGLAEETPGPLPANCSPQLGVHLASVTITNSKCHRVPPPPAAAAPVREWFAVWVGNLTPKITQEVLLRYFQPFGPIHSVRCLPRKFCAFVNYLRQDAAETAYVALQGVEVEGSRLLLQLKHPVHAATLAPSRPQQRPLKREQAQPLPPTAVPGRIPAVPKGTSAVWDASPRVELRPESCSRSELRS